MPLTRFFCYSFGSIENLGPPRGPAQVTWVKNTPELSWLPPRDVRISNDFQYVVEVEQNGHWTTIGVTKEEKISLLHLNACKKHKIRVSIYDECIFHNNELIIYVAQKSKRMQQFILFSKSGTRSGSVPFSEQERAFRFLSFLRFFSDF